MSSSEKRVKEKLIEQVTKEVKQIMEEAVTRKFVHEDSSKVTSLCGSVENCLSQGLRRRALGLFKTSSTTALLHKIAKNFEPADLISKKVWEIENADPNRRSSSSGDSVSRIPTASLLTNSTSFTKPPLQKKNSSGSGLTASAPQAPKYLWIRLALFEKVLARIIDHLVQHCSKYYDKDSLVADPEYGSILSSLLVGPCALDYSKTKTQEYIWSDPPADELVQRHRISSGLSTHLSCPRPVLNYRRSLHGVSSEEGRTTPTCAKDYVESLHQNSKATLLYGKNNVLVIPKDLTEPMPGYLSLHQTAHSLTIKWTPNQLMNGFPDAEKPENKNEGRRFSLPATNYTQPKTHKTLQFRRSSTKTQIVMYWDCAMNVRVNEIVYVHCHQQGDNGGTIVLVGQDGVQRPPIHFPGGGHLLAFLSCLENGLLPHGQLDPPLWSQRGKGKVFPKLRRKGRGFQNPNEPSSEESTDYVFQIINRTKHEDYLGSSQELLDPRGTRPPPSPVPLMRTHLVSSSTSSTSSSFCNGELDGIPVVVSPAPHSAPPTDSTFKISTGDSLQLLCNTMKKQIISRAFYGWLAYCRHLSTVRKHLSGLFNPTIVDGEGTEGGLTRELWAQLSVSADEKDKLQIFRLTYYGGVDHDIRKEVWPYLLGHYKFGSTKEEREELDKNCRQNYETTMSEWLAVEAIVRQRDKEMMAANLAKLSSESTSGGDMPPNTPTTGLAQDLSNDVFVSLNSDDEDDDDDTNDGPLVIDDSNCDETDDTQYYEAENPDDCDDQLVNHKHVMVNEVPKCPPNSVEKYPSSDVDNSTSDGVVVNDTLESVEERPVDQLECLNNPSPPLQRSESPDEGMGDEVVDEDSNDANQERFVSAQGEVSGINQVVSVIITANQSLDSGHQSESNNDKEGAKAEGDGDGDGEGEHSKLEIVEELHCQVSRSNCVSPASSQGGVYSKDLLEIFGMNLHRIDKDVQRCDRNYWYFTVDNLEKLRNVMCTYVWEHLKLGYMQGMCDLVAPLLVIFDDESLTYSCFCLLMERMGANFPHKGGAMDTHFANMRSLIQIMDSEMFELMHQNGDYTHFYFCYRWFLLDFKRELLYEDVFSVWETIWAAKHISSAHFMLFIALALVESYRDIILSNSMDFTDIIKFFNEMAERHNAKAILSLARYLVLQLQMLIENK